MKTKANPMKLTRFRLMWTTLLAALALSGPVGISNAEDAPAANTGTPAATPASSSESSGAVLNLRLQTANAEKTALEDERKLVLSFQAMVKSAKEKLSKLGEPKNLATNLAPAKTAFASLKEAWGKKDGKEAGQALQSFSNAMRGLEYSVQEANNIVYEEFRQVLYPGGAYPGTQQPSKLPAELLSVLNSRFGSGKMQSSWQSTLPNLYKVVAVSFDFSFVPPTGSPPVLSPRYFEGSDALPIPQAEEELGKVQEVFIRLGQENVTDTAKLLEAIETSVVAYLAKLAPQIEAKAKEIADVDRGLRAKENGQVVRQDKVSGHLITIFWVVMGSIVLTLVILRVKGDEQARLMIRERTAVELLSIGMFLMTILFLGTGEFLQKETLGTLLGTLAGYLFTRRGSSAGDSNADDGTPAVAVPGAPGTPTYTAATHTVSLPALPGGAKFVTAFCKLQAGGAEILLGSSATKDIVFDPVRLAAGAYTGWVVVSGDSGSSATSPQFSFTI